jgi:glutamate-1-semialdehyde 2,1-aminomutase
LLVFDEVISGFRLGFEGAAGHYNISPDLLTYGKIIGGGFPVGAYGGKADIMKSVSPEGNVYQAGTLSGNPVAMSAGIAQLTQCLSPGFYEQLEKKAARLTEGILHNSGASGLHVTRIGSIFWLAFSNGERIAAASAIDPATMTRFRTLYHQLLEEGIYLGPSGYEVGFVSAAHSDLQIDQTIEAFSRALKNLN